MLTGNKGEWSEIYTLLKLLGDKLLYPGDEHLEKIKDVFYPIVKILRSGSNGNFEYTVLDDIVIVSGNEEVLRIPIEEFKIKAAALLEHIKFSSTSTFSVPEIEEFMYSINCLSLKASSSSKTDITIVVHDRRTNQEPTLGFSIKSQLGNPSTLLNAGRTTNFIYKITEVDLSDSEMLQINSIDTKTKIKDRIQAVLEKGGSLEFVGTEQQVFSNNLILIDSLLPHILASMLFDYNTSKASGTVELLKNIEELNPLSFDVSNQHKFYSYKIKRFLTDIALGMMPSVVWTGEYDATGGYLIVKEDGEVLCYHIYNRTEFENYLLTNTRFETASSSRHGFGTIYRENNDLFFKLNLQIRFIK